MPTELPHIEAKDGDVWIDGVSYTPCDAIIIADLIIVAAGIAAGRRNTTARIIRAAADRLAHDSDRDTRPSELTEGETDQ
jgi:hypothetical protein